MPVAGVCAQSVKRKKPTVEQPYLDACPQPDLVVRVLYWDVCIVEGLQGVTSNTAPDWSLTAFHCPHCHAYAHQSWGRMGAYDRGPGSPGNPSAAAALQLLSLNVTPKQPSEICEQKNCSIAGLYQLWVATCSCCGRSSLWVGDKKVYPQSGIGPRPNSDLPEDIQRDYDEARNIAAQSPRGAAALLRLCIQKICKHLGEQGQHINVGIQSLVRKGLDPRVQRSLDIVRVIGNESVHPGQMNMLDDSMTVYALLNLVNLIAERMISHPKHIDEMYAPPGRCDAWLAPAAAD